MTVHELRPRPEPHRPAPALRGQPVNLTPIPPTGQVLLALTVRSGTNVWDEQGGHLLEDLTALAEDLVPGRGHVMLLADGLTLDAFTPTTLRHLADRIEQGDMP